MMHGSRGATMRRCRSCGNPTVGELCAQCQAGFGPPSQQPSAQVPPGQQAPPGQGPAFVYPQTPPSSPQGYPQPWAYAATPPPRETAKTGRATVAIVVGLVVLVLAAGVGMVMMMLGGDSDLAADTAVATPAPVTTIFVSVAPSPDPEPVAAPATTVAPSPVAPAPAATQAAVQPIVEEPVGDAPPAAQQVFERYYPLYRGDQGTVVTALQELLAWRGIRTLADGDFGPATERSVRLWQAQQGLTVTGVVDDTTWASLLPTLSQGSDGDGVKVLQRMLNYWGYETVVDGDFGPETDAAVRAFQMGRGIPVDGLVGPVTWSALLA